MITGIELSSMSVIITSCTTAREKPFRRFQRKFQDMAAYLVKLDMGFDEARVLEL